MLIVKLFAFLSIVLLLLKPCYAHYDYQNRITECFVKAGEYYDVPPIILWGIAYLESGFNYRAINYNKNSYDLGIMQINSRWFPELRKYGINERDLYDPCINIYVGAWILKRCQVLFNNWTDTLACYHTGKGALKNIRGTMYAKKVSNIIKRVIYSQPQQSNRSKS